MLIIDEPCKDEEAIAFCDRFLKNPDHQPRYVFGRNEYAESIALLVDVDGFVDDFTEDTQYLGKPVVKAPEIPPGSLVVAAVVALPLTVNRILDELNLAHVDYYSFQEYSGLPVKPVIFWHGFREDFRRHRAKYDWIYDRLADEESRSVLSRLAHFRLSGHVAYMEGFEDAQYRQYFEEFLDLQRTGEVFVDVGGFDGETSLEFIRRCPQFKVIHFFEPDEANLAKAKENLSPYPNVEFHRLGLSDRRQLLKFQSEGSRSKVIEGGDGEIKVDRIDNIVRETYTFLKMDIEGGEVDALAGAKESITKYRPRIAVSVYHRGDDLWRIPEQILSYNSGYSVHLRHYTEGIVETVMFFVPEK
jgi:FkbM family methyltransferase